MTHQQQIIESLQKLKIYIEKEGFKGYDPYDTLNSFLPFEKLGKWPPVLAIQFQKRNPLNIRPLLGIKKDYNPKAMGLLLHAYSQLYQVEQNTVHLENAKFLFDWLCDNSSPGYSGLCWGYNFDWASPAKLLKAYTPSIVVSGFIAKGIHNYYLQTGDKKAPEVMYSICHFLLNDLEQTETADGICFSYTPVMKDCCYNASLLGAELLARTYAINGNTKYKDLALNALDFVIQRQHDDGRWNYSLDLSSGKERTQIDFHQGFVLDSIAAILEYTGSREVKYQQALEKGLQFYMNEQFFPDGRSKWRLPRIWPVDIHNQAQGIITFSLASDIDARYLDFACSLAQWTIRNMQHHSGYFYYRKYKFYNNRIPFMRWSQAWMLLALAILLSKLK